MLASLVHYLNNSCTLPVQFLHKVLAILVHYLDNLAQVLFNAPDNALANLVREQYKVLAQPPESFSYSA